MSAAATAAAARSLVLITGASRGFGKCMALEAARQWNASGLDMHLIARSAPGLEETKQAIEALRDRQGKENYVRVWTWPIDLGDLDTLPSKLTDVFAQVGGGGSRSSPSSMRYAKAYLINNAGQVGPIAYAKDLHHDLTAVRQAVDMNVTSFVYLTSLFLQHFGGGASPSSSSSVVVVNVSSLAAVQPFHSWGMYCAGKAARDMFTQVVGQEYTPEEGGDKDTRVPLVKTINYAPGPLETDMQKELRESESLHAATREWSLEAFQEGKLVQPEVSAAKCVRILTEDRFASGAHIDYYDK